MNIKLLSVAVALSCSAGAHAQMSASEYQSTRSHIEAEYKSARSACVAFMANARDICVAEADANVKIARADLEARYKPSQGAAHKVRVARADADFAVAKEACDDQPRDTRAFCIKDAKATQSSLRAKAR